MFYRYSKPGTIKKKAIHSRIKENYNFKTLYFSSPLRLSLFSSYMYVCKLKETNNLCPLILYSQCWYCVMLWRKQNTFLTIYICNIVLYLADHGKQIPIRFPVWPEKFDGIFFSNIVYEKCSERKWYQNVKAIEILLGSFLSREEMWKGKSFDIYAEICELLCVCVFFLFFIYLQ